MIRFNSSEVAEALLGLDVNLTITISLEKPISQPRKMVILVFSQT